MERTPGKFLGLTQNGGNASDGVLFEFDYNTTSYTVKHHFQISPEYQPNSSLFLASNGKYYATTKCSTTSGSLFEYDYATNTLTQKIIFNQQPDGKYPCASLTKLSNGKFYGMTNEGGHKGVGVIFEFDPITKAQVVKHHFNNDDGSYPYGSLMQANNGLLYGYTNGGGNNGKGVLFEFNPFTTSYTVVHHFKYTTGSEPLYGALVQASNGLLYGTTQDGGDNDYGTIFQYDIATSSYTVAYHIDTDNDEGEQPYSGVIIGSNGNLFGTTYYGGLNGEGVIFEFNPTTSSYTVLHNFNDTEGYNPYAGLTEVNGKFYGVTYNGGQNYNGVIFEYDLAISSYTVKYNFDGLNGKNPLGNMYKATDGMLYGMTESGGYFNNGVVYQFNPTTSVYTKMMSFNGENGEYAYGSFIETCETPAPLVTAAQTICKSNVTVADLTATGNNVKWYDAATAGNLINPSTAVNNSLTYYAAQYIGGCEGPRIAVTVNANPSPTATVNLKGNQLVAATSGATYQWLDCNNANTAIASATLQTFTVEASGTYAVQLTKNGCSSVSSCFDIDITGVESESGIINSVYPNPNNGVFTIVSNNTNTTYLITDITGKLVKQGTISANKTEVNLNEVNTGIYFLKVDNHVTKLIKQ